MESPKSSNRDIKIYTSEVNGQDIKWAVDERDGQIWRITVIVDDKEDFTLRLTKFGSKFEALKAKVIKNLLEAFKKIDNFMRGESPEEEEQQRRYEDVTNSLLTWLVKYIYS